MNASGSISLFINLTKEGKPNSHHQVIRNKNMPWKSRQNKPKSVTSALENRWEGNTKNVSLKWNISRLRNQTKRFLSFHKTERESVTAISYRLGKKAERLIFDSTRSSLKSRKKKIKNTTFSAQKVNFTYLLIKSYV